MHIRGGYEAAAEFYDLFANNEDIPLYLRYAKRHGSPILDLAAGAGRVALKLAEVGFEVTTLESSHAMLQVARRKLKEANDDIRSRVTITKGDFRDFDLGQQFSLVVIPASFQHALTTDEQISALNSIHRHLRDDGIFILDLFPGGVQPDHASFEEPAVKLSDGRTVTRSGEFTTDHVRQILEMTLRFRVDYPEDSKRPSETIELLSGTALIYNREADLLIRMTNFELVEEFGWFDEQAYSPDSGRRILILRKSSNHKVTYTGCEGDS